MVQADSSLFPSDAVYADGLLVPNAWLLSNNSWKPLIFDTPFGVLVAGIDGMVFGW